MTRGPVAVSNQGGVERHRRHIPASVHHRHALTHLVALRLQESRAELWGGQSRSNMETRCWEKTACAKLSPSEPSLHQECETNSFLLFNFLGGWKKHLFDTFTNYVPRGKESTGDDEQWKGRKAKREVEESAWEAGMSHQGADGLWNWPKIYLDRDAISSLSDPLAVLNV